MLVRAPTVLKKPVVILNTNQKSKYEKLRNNIILKVFYNINI